MKIILRTLRITQNILHGNNIIDKTLMNKLKAIVGFRNIAVHNYQAVNLEILQEIIEKHLLDLKEFAGVMIS